MAKLKLKKIKNTKRKIINDVKLAIKETCKSSKEFQVIKLKSDIKQSQNICRYLNLAFKI